MYPIGGVLEAHVAAWNAVRCLLARARVLEFLSLFIPSCVCVMFLIYEFLETQYQHL